MTTRSLKTPAATLICLALVAAISGTASAQLGTGGSTGTSTALTNDDFLMRIQSPSGTSLRDFDLQRFFNTANCECNPPVYVLFTFSPSGFQKKNTLTEGTVEFWVGQNCGTPALRDCERLGQTQSEPLTTFATNSGITLTTDVQTLSRFHGQAVVTTPTADGGSAATVDDGGVTTVNGCPVGLAFNQPLWLLVTLNTNTSGLPDIAFSQSINVDLAPPPAPTGVEAAPGNEALIVSWDRVDVAALGTNFLGYQVLCDRGAGLQVFSNGTFSAGFQTCLNAPFSPDPTGAGQEHILGLDPTYVCSPLLSATTNSFRVKILENDVTYGVGVVAIDQSFNASQPQVIYNAPVKTLSFYDKYRNGDSFVEPGKAGGGMCSVGPAGEPRASALAAAALLIALGLVLGQRRRRQS